MREGWNQCTLGDAVTLHYGKPMRETERIAGDIPVVGSAGTFGWHNEPNVRTQSSIVVGRKGTAGSVTWFDGPVWATDTSYWVEPKIESSLEFIYLLLQNADLPGLTAQTGVPGLNRDRAYSTHVLLPPRAEQQRIVDLLGSLDDAIEAADGAAGDTELLVGQVAGALATSTTIRLGDLAKMRSGPSWGSSDESSQPLSGFDPVLAITNTRPSGHIDLTEQRYVRGLSENVMRLTAASLVMIRTNGNRGRIGNIYRSSKQVLGFAVSAFQIAIEPLNEGDSDFLYWVLAEPTRQALISNSASGSTGLGNVAIGWLKQLEIPYPDDFHLRRDFVALCEAANEVRLKSRSLVASLRAVRSEVLSVLLSGEHEIPESYDIDTAVQLEPAA